MWIPINKLILAAVQLIAMYNAIDAAYCQDKVTDCARALYMCNAGGVGEVVRGNCMLSCGLCTPAPASVSQPVYRPPAPVPHHQPLHKPKRRKPKRKPGKGHGGHGKVKKPHPHTTTTTTTMAPKPPSQPSNSQPKPVVPPKPVAPPVQPPPPKPVVVPTTTTTLAPEPKHPFFAKFLNESVNQCDNFYEYVCGTYIKNSKPEENHWPTEVHQEKTVRQRVIEMIFDTNPTASPAINKMRVYRDACMNEEAIDKAGTKKLIKDIQDIGSCPLFTPPGQTWEPLNKGAQYLQLLFTKLTEVSSNHFYFDMTIRRDDSTGTYMPFMSPEPLIMAEPEKYDDPAAHKEEIDALEKLIVDVLTIVADDSPYKPDKAKIEQAAKEIMQYDMERAKIYAKHKFTSQSKSRSKSMDKVKFSELQNHYKWFNWPEFIQNDPLLSQEMKTKIINTPNYEFLIYNKDLFKDLENDIGPVYFVKIANYYVARLILNQLPYLDKRFGAVSQKYTSKIDNRQGREKREECVDSVVEMFPLVSWVYYKKYFDAPKQAEYSQIDIKTGVKQLLQSNDVFTDPLDKQRALNKVDTAITYVGVAGSADNPISLEAFYAKYQLDPVTDSFQQMYVNLRKQLAQQKLVDIPQNSPMYDLRSTEVDDLYYRYTENKLFIPAALLDQPFMDQSIMSAFSYGALGTLIARQYMRGFDTVGINYNEAGLLVNNWMSAPFSTEFTKRSDELLAQYSKLQEKQTKQNVNGKQTLDENLLDNAGIKASFLAYRAHQAIAPETNKISGYKMSPEQVFFVSYGMSQCSATTKHFMEHVVRDGFTSPAEFRVNTVLQNYDEFAKAFNCPPTSKMNPSPKIKVW